VGIRTWQDAYAHVFPPQALGELPATLAARTEFWRTQIESAVTRQHTFAAEVDGRVVGFAAVGPTRDGDLDPESVAELYAIYVLPRAARQGVGRSLMVRALTALSTDLFREAMLWVLEDNPRTRRFYELAGWRADGAVKDDVLLDTPVREVRYRIPLD
jgi:GNAT superfamily N-acetyltransferase